MHGTCAIYTSYFYMIKLIIRQMLQNNIVIFHIYIIKIIFVLSLLSHTYMLCTLNIVIIYGARHKNLYKRGVKHDVPLSEAPP